MNNSSKEEANRVNDVFIDLFWIFWTLNAYNFFFKAAIHVKYFALWLLKQQEFFSVSTLYPLIRIFLGKSILNSNVFIDLSNVFIDLKKCVYWPILAGNFWIFSRCKSISFHIKWLKQWKKRANHDIKSSQTELLC